MKLFHSALALMVVGGLLLCATSEANAQKGKGKKKGAFGKLTEVKLKDDGTGTITVETRGKKKKKDAAAAQPGKKVTFKVTKATEIKVGFGKKAKDGSTADLKVGTLVAVRASEDSPNTAATIFVINFKKKPKKSDAQ